MIKTTYVDGREVELPETLAEKLAISEAGVLEAGDWPTLVVSTPALRAKTSLWLLSQFNQAGVNFQNTWYCASQPNAREIDHVLFAEAWDTCRMLLWVAQCTGLQDAAEHMERELTLSEHDKTLLRNAQAITEARRARSLRRDTSSARD
jgi:hypothetical protein